VGVILWLVEGIKLVIDGVHASIDSVLYFRNYRTRIRIAQDAPSVTLAAFAGRWMAHTSGLDISADGAATEHDGIGCCDELIKLTYQLSNPRGSDPAHATADATVISVEVLPGWYTDEPSPPPHVGQRGTVSIEGGLLTNHLDGFTFCDEAEEIKGTCGA
jgi:hypothetical protein